MTSEPHLNKTDDDDRQMMMMMCSLMSSDVGLTYWGQTVTSACVWFNVALRPQKPYGSLGRGAQDGHLDFHTAPELSATKLTVTMLLCLVLGCVTTDQHQQDHRCTSRFKGRAVEDDFRT